MTKVLVLESFSGPDIQAGKGSIIDIPENKAQSLVKVGWVRVLEVQPQKPMAFENPESKVQKEIKIIEPEKPKPIEVKIEIKSKEIKIPEKPNQFKHPIAKSKIKKKK